ncbi:MAG TPA: hypothetical protein VLL97_00675, partial [Acidobacteriota bacterium]|nr:hypothetical protein [Acidobacteriota bacterium]
MILLSVESLSVLVSRVGEAGGGAARKAIISLPSVGAIPAGLPPPVLHPEKNKKIAAVNSIAL